MLPDLDAIPGILTRDLQGFHNGVVHSPAFGLIVAAVVGGLARRNQRSGFKSWFLTALLCYEAHIVMDFFTGGRGVMMLWPLTDERYVPPIMLFYGLHWSDGLVSARHLWTALTELVFAAVVVTAVWSAGVAARARESLLRSRLQPSRRKHGELPRL